MLRTTSYPGVDFFGINHSRLSSLPSSSSSCLHAHHHTSPASRALGLTFSSDMTVRAPCHPPAMPNSPTLAWSLRPLVRSTSLYRRGGLCHSLSRIPASISPSGWQPSLQTTAVPYLGRPEDPVPCSSPCGLAVTRAASRRCRRCRHCLAARCSRHRVVMAAPRA